MTAARSMPSATNWRRRLRGRSLILAELSRDFGSLLGAGAPRSAARLLLVFVVLVGYGLQTGGHLNEGLPGRLLGYEFGEPPTLGGLLAQQIFEISHRSFTRWSLSKGFEISEDLLEFAVQALTLFLGRWPSNLLCDRGLDPLTVFG
jgi:hypothetical protein